MTSSHPHPSPIAGHKRQMTGFGCRAAYLPVILAELVREQAAQASIPSHRWPLGRVNPVQPVPDYEAANDHGGLPEQPGPNVA